MKKERRLSGIGAGIMLSACLSFLIGVYAPLELYLTNISEFWPRLTDFLPANAVIFGLIFVCGSAAFLIARLINEKFYSVCLAAVSAFMLAVYIQGNFLIKNLPSMSGDLIDWNSYTAEIIKSVTAFVVPFIILIVLLIKFRSKIFSKAVFIGSLCFTLLFAITLSSLVITKDLSKPETLTPTTDNEFLMSENQNFIVLMLDSFDSKCFTDILEKDSELQKELEGFTYYTNTLAAYPFTSHAVPMFYSGRWYEGKTNYRQYCTEAVLNSPFLNKLEESNFTVGIYDRGDLGLIKDTFEGKFDNCKESKMNYKKLSIYGLTVKMACLKFAPWYLKSFSDNISFYLDDCHDVGSDYELFTWHGKTFYGQIKESNPIVKTEKKNARVIHLDGIHAPLSYDENYNWKKDGSYIDKAKASVNLVKKYIERLKESGVYDNTSIVIIADHGTDGIDYGEEYNLKKRMNPLFLVKGVDEKHELKFSSAPVAYYEIPEALCKLVDKIPGDSIFDITENETRTRKLMLFDYLDENHIREFITDGAADDIDSMKETGKALNLK